MGIKVIKDRVQGLILQDERIINDNLADKDAASQPSTYTQLSPRPVLPSAAQQSDLTLKVSNEQSEDGHLEVLTNRAGHPIPEQAGYVWRNVAAGDDSENYKGWDGYQALTDWYQLRCSNTIIDDSDLNIIRLQSGNMLISGIKPTLPGLNPPILYHYDVTTAAFTEYTVDLVGPLAGLDSPDGPGLLQLPTGRVLFFSNNSDNTQVDVYYSDDEGATWAIYAMRVLGTALVDHFDATPAAIRRIRAAYSSGEVCLIIWYQESDTTTWGGTTETLWDVAQYASDDLGQNFVYQGNLIEDFNDDELTRTVRYPKILPVLGGGFVLGGYRKHQGNVAETFSYYFTRATPSAFVPLVDQEERVIYTVSKIDTDYGADNDFGCTFWVDEDNTYYALVEDELVELAVPGVDEGITHILMRSLDGASTWTVWKVYTMQTHNTDYRLFAFDADSTGGKTLMPTRWSDPESINNYAEKSVAVSYLGGYSNHTLPGAEVLYTNDFKDTDYVGWGDTNVREYALAAVSAGRGWLPIALPDSMGWTKQGSGGTISLKCDLNISCAAQNNYYQEAAAANGNEQVIAEFGFKVDSGGSLTGDGIIAALQLSDTSTYTYGVHIRCTTTGFRVRDVKAPANVGTVNVDMTNHVHIRVIMSQGDVAVWYSTDGSIEGHVREWKEGPSGTIVSGSVSPQGDIVYWGTFAVGNHESTWHMANHNFFPTRWGPRQKEDVAAKSWTNPDDLHSRSHSFLPALLFDGVKMRAQSGPTRLDEVFDIVAGYDYPVSNLDPRISPSPYETWRGNDNVKVELVWTLDEGLGAGMLDNIPFGIFALNTNIKAFSVEYYNGAAWSPLGTANANDGWESLPYRLAGNRVSPNNSVSGAAEHYVYYEQHVGDTFVLKDGEDDVPCRIQHNTEGAYYSDGTGVQAVKQPRIVIDKDQIGSADAVGVGEIWRNNFGIIFPDTNKADMVKLRFTITAHETADGYYEIGNLVIGALTAFGWEYDNNWQIQDTYNVQSIARQDRRVRTRVNGRKRKTITFSWANTAVPLCHVQKNTPVPPYVYGKEAAVSGDEAKSIFASRSDTTRTVMGVIERAGGSDIPLLLMRNIPKADSSTDVIQFTQTLDHVWGRIINDPQIDNVTGDELENEVERLNVSTMEEEV